MILTFYSKCNIFYDAFYPYPNLRTLLKNINKIKNFVMLLTFCTCFNFLLLEILDFICFLIIYFFYFLLVEFSLLAY